MGDNAIKAMKTILGYLLFNTIGRVNIRLVAPVLGNAIEKLRMVALRMQGAKIGQNSFIRAGSYIAFPKNLEMGQESKINDACRLYLFERLSIGNNVEIGPEFLVYTGEHHFSDPDKPLTKQGTHHAPVRIDDDVYMGARVTILKGVHVQSRTIIAAGSVVTNNLESGYIYGGVPAKKIKKL